MRKTDPLVITFTGGRKLHVAHIPEGRKAGTTLCGATGWRHPDFTDPNTGPVDLVLKMNSVFGASCKRCLASLERE